MHRDQPVAVGVTQRLMPENEHGERRLALDLRWPGFLARCGLVGVPLPIEPDLAETALASTQCQGVILTGGDDLAELGGRTPERDRLERVLLRQALRRQTPLAGVCRGMQLLLHAFGATLRPVPGHVATTHSLTGRPGGRRVNSFHRWAALDASAPLEVTGRCGSVVEAVRHNDKPVFGMMWHPERDDPPDPADVAFFRDLFRGNS